MADVAADAMDGAPPHNLEIEQAFLGAALVNNEVIGQVRDFLRAEHFFEPAHRRIYEAILRLIDRDHTADPIKLKPACDSDEALADVGGGAYLARLAAAAATIIGARDYAQSIVDLAVRRRLIEFGEDVAASAGEAESPTSAVDLLERAESDLYALANEHERRGGGFVDMGAAVDAAVAGMEAAYRDPDRLSGVTTGLRSLSDIIGGLHPTDLIVLAGRPGMGKTALAVSMAAAAAQAAHGEHGEHGAPVAFFSLEMAADQLAGRVLAARSGVAAESLRTGRMDMVDCEAVVRAGQEARSLPLFVDDTPALSIAALSARAQRMHRAGRAGLIVVDYLQLLSGGDRRGEGRVQEIGEITRGLKALAKKLEVPVLALSQLSRAVEQRDNKRPQLADLRESGTIEQDADLVMFVYREEYYLRHAEPTDAAKRETWEQQMLLARDRAELIVSKHRHGRCGTVNLHFDGPRMLFSDES